MATCQSTAIKIGDQVQVKDYGLGVVREIDRVRRGTDTFWVEMESAYMKRFGWHKAAGENLTRVVK